MRLLRQFSHALLGAKTLKLAGLISLLAVLASACSPTLKQFEKTASYAIAEPQQGYLAGRSQALGNPGDGRSGIRILSDGEEALAARLLLTAAAEQTIDAQYYLIHDDPTGHIFASSLVEAADRGVRVRLLLDDYDAAGYDHVTSALDLHPNIQIRLFNPFWRDKGKFLNALTDFRRINRRMHNKSMTFDNVATIIGGRNIGAEYFLADETSNYVDIDVLAAGPAAKEVSSIFDEYWNSEFAVPASAVVDEPRELSIDEARSLLQELFEEARKTEFAEALIKSVDADFQRETAKLDWVPVRVYADPVSKIGGRREADALLAEQLLPYFNEASDQVHIVSAYFVPLAQGVNWLAELENRGLDVKIVTNSIESNDVAVVYAHYAKMRKDLLRSGVELYELRPDAHHRQRSGVNWKTSRSGLHSKAITVDDRYLFVGSFNMDPRSIRINTEMGIMIDSPDITRKTIGQLEASLPGSTYHLQLTEEDQIAWLTERDDGVYSLYRYEPTGTAWQHIWSKFLGILPIGHQL